jgi:mannose-6-phosphate isomerase-like protein (cupin superfamily)
MPGEDRARAGAGEGSLKPSGNDPSGVGRGARSTVGGVEERLPTYRTYEGSEYQVLERPVGPDGALVMRFRLRPGTGSPPPHLHPHTAEIFEVLEGEFEVLVNRSWQTLGAGESVTVEPGVRHTFRNQSGADTVVRNVHDPHHDFEAYIRAVAQTSQEVRATSAHSVRTATRLALLWERHEDLIRPADPPMKIAFSLLRGIGRITGQSPRA